MSELDKQLQVEARAADDKTLFGFWTYIMTDCVLFASLFATYAVLHKHTAGGAAGIDLFQLPAVLAETLLLLTSSFTAGLAMLGVHRRRKFQSILWFAVTFGLCVAFLVLELTEFRNLVHEGNGWDRSAFLSAFFTLVGTHGLHITVGLVWMAALLAKLWQRGFTRPIVRRLTMLSYFWHFLDVVWIFIFTIVYLMGAV
jgi:cytochrome o ubiquinol oxidase subunit 3